MIDFYERVREIPDEFGFDGSFSIHHLFKVAEYMRIYEIPDEKILSLLRDLYRGINGDEKR